MKQSSGFLGNGLKVLIVIVLVAILGGVSYFAWGYYTASNQSFSFRTEKAFKGQLIATISSTGTIEPEEVIDIGAQINGQVIRFGPDLEAMRKNLDLTTQTIGSLGRVGIEADIRRRTLQGQRLSAPPPSASYSTLSPQNRAQRTVDWCTNVEAGDILCILDDSLYGAIVTEKDAALTSAKADLESKLASKRQADREWERAEQLKPNGGISLSDYDTAHANYETTKAAVGLSKAQIGLAEAQLVEAKINLGYTRISSPVKGVIIDRRVNVGQTVVSGLSAPSLFLLAKDLKRVQVWVSVNEADVGTIKKALSKAQETGKPVAAEFTTDAFPGELFHGTVTKVRLNAMMTQNVVTYIVEVATDNPGTKEAPDGMLMPYLTANVKFIIEQKDHANLVPNSALRWRPPAGGVAHVHPDYRQTYEASLRRKSSADEGSKGNGGDTEKNPNLATVWVEKDGFARPVKVITGKTDNINTEIMSLAPNEKDPSILDFDAGSPLIVGEAQGGPTGTVNPFAPKMFGGKKQ